MLFPIISLSVAGCDTPQSPIRRTRAIHGKMPANWFRCNEQKFDKFDIKLGI